MRSHSAPPYSTWPSSPCPTPKRLRADLFTGSFPELGPPVVESEGGVMLFTASVAAFDGQGKPFLRLMQVDHLPLDDRGASTVCIQSGHLRREDTK